MYQECVSVSPVYYTQYEETREKLETGRAALHAGGVVNVASYRRRYVS